MKKVVKTAVTALFWLGIWEIISIAVNQRLIIVSPLDTVKRICELSVTADFWSAVGVSFLQITAGLICAAVIGTLLAVLSAALPVAFTFLSPLLSVIKATPVASFTLILFLWIKAKYLSIVIAFIMVLPVIYFGVYQGIKSTDVKLLEMARVFGVPKRKIIKEIYVPSVAPFLISALSVSVGFAWKSGIAAEVICIADGTVGGKLYDAKLLLESADIFAWTAVIIIISKIIEYITVKLLKKAEKAVM